MAIESDQLVFDYLSRVGDLAQQRQLPSKTRMRLVAELRADIDRRRATVSGGKTPGDSPAGVRRILDRLGTPEEVVDRAAGTSGGSSGGADADSGGSRGGRPAPVDVPAKPETATREPAPEPAVPAPESEPEPAPKAEPKFRLRPSLFVPEQRADEQRADEQRDRPARRRLPRPRLTKEPAPPAEPPPATSTPPHLAGEDEMGPSGSTPDWWRIESGPQGFADSVPGFVGGVEIPEILRPPRPDDEGDEGEDGNDAAGGASGRPSLKKSGGTGKPAKAVDEEADDEDEEEPGSARRLPFLRRAGAARGAPSFSNPLLLLAAVSLVVGAVLGNWIALGLGWAIAYTSRRLTQREAKFAALGIPGLTVVAGVVWLWGRFDRQWGEAVPKGATADALAQTWPWVVRLAAVASALFLVWRSQRQRPE